MSSDPGSDAALELLLEELLRVDPRFRDTYYRPGAAGLRLDVRRDSLAEAVAALRELPDDAGASAVNAALAPFRLAAPSQLSDCWFCGAASRDQQWWVSGNGLVICGACVQRALEEPGAMQSSLAATEGAATRRTRCGFCGSRAAEGPLYRGRWAAICRNCANNMSEMLE